MFCFVLFNRYLLAKLKAKEKAEKAAKADAKKQEPKKGFIFSMMCCQNNNVIVLLISMTFCVVKITILFWCLAAKLEFQVEKFDQAAALKKIEG